jgi:hypothetical protein
MENNLRKLIRFEDKIFWVDLSGENFIFDEVNSDGSRIPGSKFYFMDALMYGMIIGDEPPKDN